MSNDELIIHLKERVLHTPGIVKAFEKTDRIDFIPVKFIKNAYDDEPLSIGYNQTISQPYTVAFMTEMLEPKKGNKILEIGTGSGWQAAILSEIVGKKGKVITVERIKELAKSSRKKLKKYKNIYVVEGDGSKGYEKESPYDRIIVTASASSVPDELIKQLKLGGKMIIPVGKEMFLFEKINEKDIKRMFLGFFVFVPLVRD